MSSESSRKGEYPYLTLIPNPEHYIMLLTSLSIATFKNAPMCMKVLLDAGLEIGDCGSYYFYYTPEINDWRVYSDCY